MFRTSTIQYKVKNKVMTSVIFVNDFNDHNANEVSLLLSRDRETGEIRRSVDRDGVEQYTANQPVTGGAYAFIPVDTMRALKALGLTKVQPNTNRIWVRLQLDSAMPSYRDMDTWADANL